VTSDATNVSLARGAAVMTIATTASRVTGFLRVVVVAAAMGTTFLANTYQTANTTPNLIFELVAAGTLTSVFVPTFVSYLTSGRRDEGWRTADVLTSVALVGLIGMALVVALAAPAIMRLLTIGVEDDAVRREEVALGATFLRLFAPQIVFYGAGMIMTAALHAHRRFLMPAVAPIFNNLVVIGVYLVYVAMRSGERPTLEGISTAETFVLGAGTTMGVVAMTLCLVPELRRLGWRFRLRIEPRHPAVRKSARLGAWALGYAGGYQAGLIVVLLLANRIEGGVAAYQWAYTFFYVPHALFAVPVFNVLFPTMSELSIRGEEEALMARLRDGLGMLVFILVPVAALMVAAAQPIAAVTLQYGAMTSAGAELTARVIAAFAVGLPTYSAFLVLTRAYYALSDTKTPTLVNASVVAVSSALGAGFFILFERDWAVAGLAAGHSIAFAGGAYVLARLLAGRTTRAGSTALVAASLRSLAVGAAALLVMVGVSTAVGQDTRMEAVADLAITTLAGAGVYLGGMSWIRSPEWQRIRRLLRSRGS
jgi:putative peptidoglycan lipid II flippase